MSPEFLENIASIKKHTRGFNLIPETKNLTLFTTNLNQECKSLISRTENLTFPASNLFSEKNLISWLKNLAFGTK